MENKEYMGNIIDVNYFSDTLIISRGILKALYIEKKTYTQLLNEKIDIDNRVLHKIPYNNYLKYVIYDLTSRGLITLNTEEYFEITQKGRDIHSNYVLDNLALTAYSNRLSRKSNTISIIIAVIALLIAIIGVLITI